MLVWPLVVHGAGLKMDSQQGPTAQHTELCSMLRDVLDGRGVKARMDTCIRGFPSLSGTEYTCNVGDSEIQMRFLGWEDPLEEEMTTILAWKNPTDRGIWQRIESTGSQRIGRDLTTAHVAARVRTASPFSAHR